MGRIRVLDDSVINRIAAGEVVERPAAVVKELVENSLDAGATAIEVRLEAGGKRRIEVRDDGSGMDRDDALLALERHATSKLAKAEDLNSITTLGFRGEALASVAAVSQLLLQTASAAPGAPGGDEIEVRWGKIVAVRRSGLPPGTTLRVDRLFGNTPARRKFLRGDSTELAHVLRAVTRLALAHPQCRFVVEHSGRRLLEAPAAADRAERISQIYGAALARTLLAFRLERAGVVVSGFAGRPVDASTRRTAQHFFVNGRAVQDRLLAHALGDAYGNTTPHGRHPAAFVFVDLPPEAVDVNVHPQKAEVRFRDSGQVHDLVRDALRSALAGGAAVPGLRELRPQPAAAAVAEVREAVASYLARSAGECEPSRAARERPAPTLVDAMQAADDERRHRRAVPLAQFRDSYIVAEDAEGLLLVDQHAAHERVLFERYLAEAERGSVETQRLMFPLTFDASPEELARLDDEREELDRLGFSAEPFGGSIRLDAIPAVAAAADPERLLRDLLGEAAHTATVAAAPGGLRRRLVTTAACHAAIKVNHRLSPDAMQGLLDRLWDTENPTTCPHGRPSLFRLSLEEIERAFRRR